MRECGLALAPAPAPGREKERGERGRFADRATTDMITREKQGSPPKCNGSELARDAAAGKRRRESPTLLSLTSPTHFLGRRIGDCALSPHREHLPSGSTRILSAVRLFGSSHCEFKPVAADLMAAGLVVRRLVERERAGKREVTFKNSYRRGQAGKLRPRTGTQRRKPADRQVFVSARGIKGFPIPALWARKGKRRSSARPLLCGST
ncbi:hypothetical protein B0T26DRAFT_702268 [Lasiosphaeria miniovina]|uniref:Uncharacterized protein n=1 Tax=Lasiosphaeria miniovina TaxID=1954250 RepID=A0AA40E4L3_9PEZI|nr:uncharacterized protein B0T26DRAFT_702268 [Lasiosphaeria miniovina]KAK0722328.1 hypothetical protein B0T26DRAFT_702268 [Lasiosphaeria miniovina]